MSMPGEEIGGRAAWVAGLYALRATETNDQLDMYNGAIAAQLASRYESTNLAAYARGRHRTHRRRQAFHRRAGRASRRRLRRTPPTNAFDPAETMIGGHVSLELHAAESGGVWYAHAGARLQGGRIQHRNCVPADRRTFGAEYLWNLETGVKTLLGGRTRVDARRRCSTCAARDQQVSTSFQLEPGDPLTFVFFTDNAARGENYGLESSLSWRRGRGLEFGGSARRARDALYRLPVRRKSRSRRPRAGACAAVPVGAHGAVSPSRRACSRGSTPSGSTISTSIPATMSARRRARSSTSSSGSSASAGPPISGLATCSTRYYAVRGFFFGNEPPDFSTAKRYMQPGDPRQVGVTFNYSFR